MGSAEKALRNFFLGMRSFSTNLLHLSELTIFIFMNIKSIAGLFLYIFLISLNKLISLVDIIFEGIYMLH